MRLDRHNQELHPDEALTLADARTPVVLGATLQVPELPLRAHARSPHPTNLLLLQVCYRNAIEAGQKAEVQHVMSNALAVAYHPQTDITEILGVSELSAHARARSAARARLFWADVTTTTPHAHPRRDHGQPLSSYCRP